MRTALWGMVVAGSTLAGWLSLGAGCGTLPAECSERFTCLAGSGGGSTTTTTTSGTGGDSGPPPQCVPDLVMNGAVADTCGIFVSSSRGDDNATDVGSKKAPYKTLTAALAATGGGKTRVYACAESFTESVKLSGATGLFGGLDCTKDWIYAGGTRSTLTAGADSVPLTLTLSKAAPSVEVVDFEVNAADATAEGGSSIAVVTDAINVSFTRCSLLAGNGVKGADGVMRGESPGPSKPTDALIVGNNGADACSNAAMDVAGGKSKENTLCMSSANPIGGSGGDGTTISGKGGESFVANEQTALGGVGQPNSGVWSCAGTSTGTTGLIGEAGMDGAGAIGAASLGKLALTGYIGVAGGAGIDGKPGQGGGGGGGAKGKAGCGGASGGSGGAGGCGGLGGTGGSAGGASIGLVSLGATLSFTEVTIKLGTGGAGGEGGDGHSGRIGGNGGAGGVGSGMVLSGCRGGDGGQGGFGGKGGGGRGGHAIGIAASGAAPPSTEGVTVTPGTPGLGGKGGVSQDGEPGVQSNGLAFP